MLFSPWFLCFPRMSTATSSEASGEVERKESAEAYKIDVSEKKGRILRARRRLSPGDVILVESPVMSASWHIYKCFCCNLPHPTSSCEQVLRTYPEAASLLKGSEVAGVKSSKNRKKKKKGKAKKVGTRLGLDDISVALAEFERIEELDRARFLHFSSPDVSTDNNVFTFQMSLEMPSDFAPRISSSA